MGKVIEALRAFLRGLALWRFSRFSKASNGYFLDLGNWHGRGVRLSWMPRTMTVGPEGWFHYMRWNRAADKKSHIALRYGA